MTRKEQIAKFKESCMKREEGKTPKMVSTRLGFLMYAFIRGRFYKQQERATRPYEETGFDSAQAARSLAPMIRTWFPIPDPTPVPVPAGGEEEEPLTPRGYPWPEVDYLGLVKQMEAWFGQEAPDQKDWEAAQAKAKAKYKAWKEKAKAEWAEKRKIE